MLKKWTYLFLILGTGFVYGQECPILTAPTDGATNVPVNTTIAWNPVTGVPGYIISLGLTPGGNEILEQSVGSTTSFTPPLGLPSNTQIYVTLTLFFFNQPNITCSTESFRTENITTPPACTNLQSPADGSSNINGATNISWNYVPGATGYIISLGTTPGGNEIVGNLNVGNILTYNPPGDLPPDSDFYVRIVPENNIGTASGCNEYSFSTGPLVALPGCTSLISPMNGAVNVPLTPLLQWAEIPGAVGYKVSIGSSPFVNDVLDNVSFFTNATFVIDFEPNRTFFMTIIPFNGAGEAVGCTQESFSTLLGCGPFFDPTTGNLVTLNPTLNFPDEIGICLGGNPTMVTSQDDAEGFRWFKVDSNGNELLISDTLDVVLTEVGSYRYEAYNTLTQSGSTVECSSSKTFVVVASESATIPAVNVSEQANGLRLEIVAQGTGSYEYALNTSGGPYQDSNVFENVTPGSNTVYVRDKNGCGIVELTIDQDITIEGFPKFFTPNGDNINDYWQYIPPYTAAELNLETIFIFDRFGVLLTQISPNSQGWDGNLKGHPLPATDYWFKALSGTNKKIVGHFTLKR